MNAGRTSQIALVLCAVFVPIAFMDGIIGRFFLQFGVTVAVAVLVSLFVSFTLDPMLSSVWPDPVKDRFKYVPWLGRIMARIEVGIEHVHGIYGRVLGLALRWRKSTLALALGIFVGSRRMLEQVLRFAATTGIAPVVDRVFGFDQAQEAYRYMESGSHFGKVVIAVSG